MQAWEERYYAKQEAREEGLAEGRAEGRAELLTSQIQKKLTKGKSIEIIADELELTTEEIAEFIAQLTK